MPRVAKAPPCLAPAVAAWLRGRLVAPLALGLAAAACGPPPVPPKLVSVRFSGEATDARVTIDDLPIGPLAMLVKRGIALPAGTHRITVEAPGYLPWDRLVEATGEPVRLDVKLVPIPD